jgi:hypothetical protein
MNGVQKLVKGWMNRSGRKEMEEPRTGELSADFWRQCIRGAERSRSANKGRHRQGEPGTIEMKAKVMRLRVGDVMDDGG